MQGFRGAGFRQWGGYRPAGLGAWGGYRPRYGGWGGYRPRYWGGYRPAGYYGRYRYGYWPGYYRRFGYGYPYGYRRYGYGYGYGYPYYYGGYYNGGAVAAGLFGGLALGALAATAAQPYYADPLYRECWTERRRTVNAYGNRIVRRVRVCDVIAPARAARRRAPLRRGLSSSGARCRAPRDRVQRIVPRSGPPPMTMRFHRGDLPAGLSARPGDRHRHRDARAEPAPGPALRGPDLDRRRHRRRRPDPADGPAPDGAQARVLADESVLKIFHFARFDLAVLFHALGVMPRPVYCTKIASRLARTYTDRHGLKDLVRELIGIDLSKQQQSSDWGAETLTPGPARLCGLRRAPPPRPEGAARRHARARAPGSESPRTASRSCRPGPSSTCSAGRRRTSSPIVDAALSALPFSAVVS